LIAKDNLIKPAEFAEKIGLIPLQKTTYSFLAGQKLHKKNNIENVRKIHEQKQEI